MNKTDAQKRAIDEKYSKEGEMSKKKEPHYDAEGKKEHKESDAYRMKKDEKEEKDGADKEGREKKHKCSFCGEMH
jgi:hypothetical protein